MTFIWVPVGELVTYMVSSPDEPMGVRVRLEQLDNIMSLFTMFGFLYKMTRITYGYNLCILLFYIHETRTQKTSKVFRSLILLTLCV